MHIPRSLHTTIVLEALIDHFRNGKGFSMDEADLPAEFLQPAPCFVSIYLPNQVMRGCMGSFEPMQKNLYQEIEKNSLLAAFGDKRFAPLAEKELEELSMMVEVVRKPERIYNPAELDPEKFGVIVKNQADQMGVLLPKCPGVDSPEKQVAIAMQKGGMNPKSPDFSKLRLYRFLVDQFY